MVVDNESTMKSQRKSAKIWTICFIIIALIACGVFTGLFLHNVLKGSQGGGLEISDRKVDELKSYLGARVMALDEILKEQLNIETSEGVLVNSVIEGSPAEKAGIQRGDVIVRFNRRVVSDLGEFMDFMVKTSPGDKIKIVVEREKKTKVFYVELVEISTATTPVALTDGRVPDETHTPAIPTWGMEISALTPQMLQGSNIPPEQRKGVVVTGITTGGAAAAAGIQAGDIILSANQQPTSDPSEFYKAIAGSQGVALDIFRGGQTSFVTVQANPSSPPVVSLGMTTSLPIGIQKVAIATVCEGMNGMLSSRFSTAQYFIIVTLSNNEFVAIINQRSTTKQYGIRAAQVVIDQNVQAIITIGIGPQAFAVLSSSGVKVYIGKQGETAKEALEEFKKGQLEQLQSANISGMGAQTTADDPNQGDPQRPSYAGAAKGQRDLDPASSSSSQTGGGEDEDDKGQKPSIIPPMSNPNESEALNVVNIWQTSGQPVSSQPEEIPPTVRPSGIQTAGAQTIAGTNRVQVCLCPVCGTTVAHPAGVPCSELTCPECGSRLIPADQGLSSSPSQQGSSQQGNRPPTAGQGMARGGAGGSSQQVISQDSTGSSRYGSSGSGGPSGACVCPLCGTIVPHTAGVPCYEMKCPKCGTALVRAITGVTVSDKPETTPPADKGAMMTHGSSNAIVAVAATGKNLSSKVAPIFDRAPYLIFVGLGSSEALRNPNSKDSKDVGVQSAQFVVDNGAGVVITNNISLEAMRELGRLNVKVFSEVSGTVSQAIGWYMDGRLSETTVGTPKGSSDSDDEGKGKEKKGRDATKTSVEF